MNVFNIMKDGISKGTVFTHASREEVVECIGLWKDTQSAVEASNAEEGLEALNEDQMFCLDHYIPLAPMDNVDMIVTTIVTFIYIMAYHGNSCLLADIRTPADIIEY